MDTYHLVFARRFKPIIVYDIDINNVQIANKKIMKFETYTKKLVIVDVLCHN